MTDRGELGGPAKPNIVTGAEGTHTGAQEGKGKVRAENKSRDIPPGLEVYATNPFNASIFRLQMHAAQIPSEDKLADAAIKHDNLLGTGGNGRVYRIPDIATVVLKVPGVYETNEVAIDEVEELEDPFPNLNVGQPVAKMGEGLLLKAQIGIPAGGALGEAQFSPENIARYEERLKIAADMPPNAYEAYALLLEHLHENGFITDGSKSSNILMDTDQGVFNAVDVHQSEDAPTTNTIVQMIVPLVDTGYAHKLKDADPEAFMRTQEDRKKIASQVLEIGQKLGLPYPDEKTTAINDTLKITGILEVTEEDNNTEIIEEVPDVW